MNSGGPQTTSFRNRTPLYHEGKGPDKSYSSYLWRGIESHDDARTHEDIENHDDARTVQNVNDAFVFNQDRGILFNQVFLLVVRPFFYVFPSKKKWFLVAKNLCPCHSLPVFLVWFDGRTVDVCLWTFGVLLCFMVFCRKNGVSWNGWFPKNTGFNDKKLNSLILDDLDPPLKKPPYVRLCLFIFSQLFVRTTTASRPINAGKLLDTEILRFRYRMTLDVKRLRCGAEYGVLWRFRITDAVANVTHRETSTLNTLYEHDIYIYINWLVV